MKTVMLFFLLFPYLALAQEAEKLTRIRPNLESDVPIVKQYSKYDTQLRVVDSLEEKNTSNLVKVGNSMVLIKPPKESRHPLFVVNGIEVTEYAVLINKDDIEKIYIEKDAVDQNIYNRIGVGKIVIQTKNPTSNTLTIYPSESQREPVFIADGLLIEDDTSVSMNDIESISILFDIMFHPKDGSVSRLAIEVDADRWNMPDFIRKFKSFTNAQPYIDTLDEAFLKQRNSLYANEWNKRYNDPLRYASNVYSMYISYNANESYGFNVEQKLYLFFKFITEEYSIAWGDELNS